MVKAVMTLRSAVFASSSRSKSNEVLQDLKRILYVNSCAGTEVRYSPLSATPVTDRLCTAQDLQYRPTTNHRFAPTFSVCHYVD